ncbi:MAG: hypothetical protein RI973_1994 [Bacteroidota bacterium]|jgi:hypothetical protein
MTLLENTTGILGALFMITGLYAVGNLAERIAPWKKAGRHFNISLGFSLFYFFFLEASALVHPWSYYLIYFLMGLAIVWNFREIRQGLRSFAASNKIFLLVTSIVALPFFLGLISPPVNFDGVSFYLPSAEWIYRYGLTFNHYLPSYTTMPQGAEYLFSAGFGIGGYQAIRMMDAIFTLLLIDLIRATSIRYLSLLWTGMVICLVFLMPETLLYVFGSGKVDTLGTYFFVVGFTLILRFREIGSYLPAVLALSAALAIKYTNWLLLILPLTGLFLLLLMQKKYRMAMAAAAIPLLFTMPVLIKNQIEVNNPLAPVIITGKPTRFVFTHGEMPSNSDIPTDLLQNDTALSKAGNKYQGVVNTLKGEMCWIISAVMAILLLLRLAGRLPLPEFWTWYLFLLLCFVPWFYELGDSPQPLRFIWPPLVILTLLVLVSLKELVAPLKIPFRQYTAAMAIFLVGLPVIGYSYYRHGRNLHYFIKSQELSLADWYAYVGQEFFSISARMREAGFHHQDVFYLNGVALGLFDVRDYGNLPNAEQQAVLSKYGLKTYCGEKYIFDRMPHDSIAGKPVKNIFISKNYHLMAIEE